MHKYTLFCQWSLVQIILGRQTFLLKKVVTFVNITYCEVFIVRYVYSLHLAEFIGSSGSGSHLYFISDRKWPSIVFACGSPLITKSK